MGDGDVELTRKESWRMRQAIRDKSGQREELHTKTFGKWMNVKLARRDPPSEVNNLIEDIQDGKLLLDLLEVLLGTKLRKEKGNLRVHKLNNIERAMALLEKNNVKLVGISSFDIADGKPRAILGLLWSIILRFQVQDVMQEAVTEEAIKDYSIEKKIIHWCKDRLKSYGESTKITDFSHSWKDGLAFNALLHSYRPELFKFDELLECSSQARLNHAFSVAKNKFGVPHLLEAADMDVERPDKRLIIMYLCTLYDYLEGSMAKENVVVVAQKEEEDGAANDSWDLLDTGPRVSSSEHDKAVKDLSEKLEEVKAKIIQAEADKPVYNEKESLNSLKNHKKGLDKQKKFIEDLEPLKCHTYEVLNDGRRMIGEGYFDKGEEEDFGGRMDNVDHKMQQLLEDIKHTRDELSQSYGLLLKQQLAVISQWVEKGEKKMKSDKESNEYEEVKKQLEDHQTFQEELGDISLITLMLEMDGSDPNVDQQTFDDVKRIGPLWKSVWDWSEDHKNELITNLVDWQEFRDEELVMLNWLSQKEKMLKEVLEVDVADVEKVKEQLKRLEATQKELEEQDMRLKKLQKCGDKLIGKVGEDSATAEEIRTQLEDFNDCWEQVAKRVLEGKEKLITSSKKMAELQEDMDSVNAWIDGAERDIGDYKDDMDAEAKNNIRDKIEIMCEERPSTEQKVDRINRVGKDLSESLDGPSVKEIRGDVEKLNERWRNVNAALESFSDKGYPDINNNECCLLRIMKRKLFSLY